MRAVRLHYYTDAPRIDDIPSPSPPGEGELTIDVTAVGTGAWDEGVATGRLAKFVKAELPIVMGAELVGRVAGIGPCVDGFEIGNRVMCNPGIVGAWAEQVTVPAPRCGHAPKSLDDPRAAALPVGALTAIQALDKLALPEGASLLVLGTGGSVGRAALQLAASRGLAVHALAPAHELERSRELGAHVTYAAGDNWHGELRTSLGNDLDAVLDLVGGDTLRESATLLRGGGHIVTTLAESMACELPPAITIKHLHMRSTTADLNAIAAAVDGNALTVSVERVLRFEELPATFDRSGESRHSGKVVAEV